MRIKAKVYNCEHTDRPHEGRGLCKSCYDKALYYGDNLKYSKQDKIVLRAICHPERPHKANGLCSKCYLEDWHKKNPSHLATNYKRKSRLKIHGLTPEDFNTMLIKQKNVCKICNTFSGGKILSVDHDHKTGRVRGLLCSSCNLAIGLMKDSPKLLRQAAKYLEDTLLSSIEKPDGKQVVKLPTLPPVSRLGNSIVSKPLGFVNS